MKNVLLYAEAALPKSQFDAFRKLVLNEFGRTGAEGKIRKLFMERNGQAQEGIHCTKGVSHECKKC